MVDLCEAPILQASSPRSRRPLLWLGASILSILLFISIFRFIQSRAKKIQPLPPATGAALATITNSGSTNMPASTLTIMKDGSGILTYQKGPQQEFFSRYVDKTFPQGTFEISSLETILAQIQDVSTIPNHDCLKSASFGSTTTVTYQGKTSGDISCLSNADAKIFLDLKSEVQRMTSHV